MGMAAARGNHRGALRRLTLLIYFMSRLLIARALTGAGLGASGVAAFVSLFGILGVIATTGALCPESIGPARCNAAASKAANLAALSFVACGVASGVAVAGRVIDPEA